MVQQMMDYPPMTLLVGWGLVWLAYILAYRRLDGHLRHRLPCGLALAAIVIMPLMLKHLSGHRVSMWRRWARTASWRRACSLATVLFIVGWVVSIPLWLIPGFSCLFRCCSWAG
jgi:hypothetical protein